MSNGRDYSWTYGRAWALLIWYEVDERQLGTGGWSQDESDSLVLYKDPITWDPCRYSFYSSDPVIQCLYSYGGQLCKLRADGSVPGRRRDHGS